MAGLLDMYQLAGNRQALDVLEKQAAWVKFRMDRLTHEQQQAMLRTEHGGMNEVLANLYAVTGNADVPAPRAARSTTRSSSTRSPAARTRSTACTPTRRSPRSSAPRASTS